MKKPHTRTHERNGFPWDKRTSTQTCAEKCSAHWAVLSKAQEATPGKSLRQTSMTATAVLDTHTSCHLSLHISGLINNLCGFASCLFLSCGTKCLHMSVRAVCVVNKETGSPTAACLCCFKVLLDKKTSFRWHRAERRWRCAWCYRVLWHYWDSTSEYGITYSCYQSHQVKMIWLFFFLFRFVDCFLFPACFFVASLLHRPKRNWYRNTKWSDFMSRLNYLLHLK